MVKESSVNAVRTVRRPKGRHSWAPATMTAKGGRKGRSESNAQINSFSRRILLLLPACGEKVGMRGPLGWAEIRATVCNAAARPTTLRIAERPPHPRSLRSLDLSPHAGRGENAHSFSRRMCARVLLNLCLRLAPVRRFSIPSHATETRGSGTPRDAGSVTAPRERALPLVRAAARGGGAAQRRGRSPLGVPPRLSSVGRNRLTHSRPGFLGRGRSAGSGKPAPTGGGDLALLRGRYPRPPVPVQ